MAERGNIAHVGVYGRYYIYSIVMFSMQMVRMPRIHRDGMARAHTGQPWWACSHVYTQDYIYACQTNTCNGNNVYVGVYSMREGA